ncbi:MAG: arginine--tRNA ligase [Bdellovibrionaceae bacterium]|nr:arginine--tRNA ligase [Pseudobdellovibrionaceae bacterium]
MLQLLKEMLSPHIAKISGLGEKEIYSLLEIPKNPDHGHLALPVFSLAKELRRPPVEIAEELAKKLQGVIPDIQKIHPVSGFLNFGFAPACLQRILFTALRTSSEPGDGQEGQGRTVIIDFSSPNVAKPMHIGHFRATVIGQAICNLARSQGYKVVGVNHIGDWGTQFGKLAWAYLQWGRDYDFSVKPIDAWLALYVRFHEQAEANPELEKFGAETFRRLEMGDPEIRKIWQRIVDDSFVEYNKLYDLIGVRHDLVMGESAYNDKLDDVIGRLEKKNLLKESDGAQVVFFPESLGMPPCIIRKSDGASIYATRDLAAAIYRREVLKADKLLYVVAADQSLHFRQVFEVLKMLGYEWSKDCEHISFGLYRFKEGKMSTRRGKLVLFEDVIYQAIDSVKKMIDDKNPDLPDKDKVSRQVAAGAIIFNDLVNDRVKGVDFDWDRVLNMEGDSGPYVQYTNVRCRSLLRKAGRPVGFESPQKILVHPDEQRLLFLLLQFDHIVATAWRLRKPNIVAQYLLDLCGAFSHFYHNCRILGEAQDVETSRLSLVAATNRILTRGLALLNIESPEVM